MEDLRERIVGELVAEDYRFAEVFKRNGIDFCCRGNRTVERVAKSKGIDADKMVAELQKAKEAPAAGTVDFRSWPLDLLADYIEKTHHKYVEEKLPQLSAYLQRIADVHGDRHPELNEINELFKESAGDLAAHMKKEELILFPFIRKMVKAEQKNEPLEAPHFGTVENPVSMMKHEHDNEGVRFRKIAELSSNYTPPADACNTYRVAYALLNEFENDLHQHIHLENNILFPASIEKEKKLSSLVV